jgi:two-component system phosphate regulon response regulator PhoB
MPVRVLVVDDEHAIREMISYALSKAGIAYELAETVQDAERALESSHVDLIVLDWMLPDTSGVDLARRLRSQPATANLPIIMLTARGEEEDKVHGLNAGADDYITKPFSPKELVARIHAVLRRAGNRALDVIEAGGLKLDAASRRVYVQSIEVQLSLKEFEVLQALMTNPDRVFSRAQLLDLVWPRSVHVGERTVDVHVSSLRRALEPFGCDGCIQTVRGAGYRFTPT